MNDDEHNIKAKKIRRILLLKTDQELKINSKRYLNILINSKTIQELNKAYNSYTILLSESSPIYSNYVQIFERIIPNNSSTDLNKKETLKQTIEEQDIKSLNSSFDSQSPAIDFVPNKIDLGKKRFSFVKKGSINNENEPKILEEIDNNIKEIKNKEEEVKVKSSKLGNKNINRVIDKIVQLKLTNDKEDDDNIIKNVIKLRKYCFKLIKKRKKYKKVMKQKVPLSPKKNMKDRPKAKKRKTLVNFNIFGKKSLFGIKEGIQEPIIKRRDTLEDITKKAKGRLNKGEIKLEKRGSFKSNSHEITNKMHSFKDLKTIREKQKEKINIENNKKRKLRRVQTLNIRNQPFINKLSQKKEIKKTDSALKQVNQLIKESITSTKFTRPSKFVIINNNINNANIILKKEVNKKNSLFNIKKSDFQKQKSIREKEKTSVRNSVKMNGKHTVKLFSPEFKGITKSSDS